MTENTDAESTRPVYFLLHLPKTAGQTITGHLRAHCPPGTYLEPTRHQGLPQDSARLNWIRALSGHWLSRDMERAFAGREIRRTALLRDPVAVQVSLYNFHMITYRAKRLGTYGFGLHLAAQPRNFLTWCILTRWMGLGAWQVALMSDAEQFARADAALSTFWFVGTHRDCDRLIVRIAEDLEIPSTATPRNETAQRVELIDWEPLAPNALDRSVVQRIENDHPVDRALWRKYGFGEAPPPLPTRRRPIAALVRSIAEGIRLVRRDWSGTGRIGQQRRVDRALAAEARGDWDAAATLFEKAIARGGASTALLISHARALRALNQHQQALESFEKALALKPDMPTIVAERDAVAALDTPFSAP